MKTFHTALSRVRRSLRDAGRTAAAERDGQSTVEYAIVLFAFLAMLAALAALWESARDGTLADIAKGAASHGLSRGLTLDALRDIALF